MSTLSLRRRLQIGLAIAVTAIAAMLAGLAVIVGESDAARARDATSAAETIARTLAVTTTDAASLRTALGNARDAAAGSCTAAGQLRATTTVGPRGQADGRPPPPDVVDALEAQCRDAMATMAPRIAVLAHPRDIAGVAVVPRPRRDGLAAWAMVRIPRPDSIVARSWPWSSVLLAFVIVVLAVNTIDTLRALRSGVDQIDAGLASLEVDLHAPIARPRANELGRIADGLRRMADRLAASRERERTLEGRLAHEQQLSALGRVVAGVAHEVRNPLAGIKLHLDLVMRSAERPKQSLADVAAALDEVARLDQMVTSLLTVARRAHPPEAIELGSLIDQRIGLISAWAGDQGVALRRTGDARVMSDPDAITRAVDNLVRNAVEASPRGEPVCVEIASDGQQVTIDVLDRGPGLAPGIALFEPFFTTKPEGVGLGSFVARSLVVANGGSITYAREAPWTRMRITLPTS